MFRKFVFIMFILSFGFMGLALAQEASAPAPAVSACSPKVKEAIDLLKSKASALGAPSLQNGELMFGTTKISSNFDIVDAVNSAKGCTATFFIKEEDNFMRVSTNVMVEGKRAVGTALDVRGKAYEALSSGNSFYGVIDVLGKKYDTAYEPIKDANGNVIGAYYIGFAA